MVEGVGEKIGDLLGMGGGELCVIGCLGSIACGEAIVYLGGGEFVCGVGDGDGGLGDLGGLDGGEGGGCGVGGRKRQNYYRSCSAITRAIFISTDVPGGRLRAWGAGNVGGENRREVHPRIYDS